MEFGVSAHHRQLRSRVRELLAREAPPAKVAEMDEREEYPADLYAKVADIGLCAVTVPVEYGGAPEDELGLCVIAEEVARASAALTYAYLPTVTLAAPCIAGYGTEVQRRKLLPRIARGELRFALALTEAGAGSDLSRVRTWARWDQEGLVVRGHKVMVAGAANADYLLTFLVVESDAGEDSGGLSALLIPVGAEGVRCRKVRTLAGQATPLYEVSLDDVRVGRAGLVGGVGGGRRMLATLLDRERIHFAAQACGIADGTIDLVRAHLFGDHVPGRAKIDVESFAPLLADMVIDLEAARMLTLRAAWKLEQGQPVTSDSAMAKVFSSEAAARCVDRGWQILGDRAGLVEAGMERYYRECKVKQIAGGTNQILRTQIIRRLDVVGTQG